MRKESERACGPRGGRGMREDRLRGKIMAEVQGERLVVSGMRDLTDEELGILRRWLLEKPCYLVRDALTELTALQREREGSLASKYDANILLLDGERRAKEEK